jgi:PHD/YefM family antitoxin component YafN of YafNO toxin-antitoxin module
MRHIIPIVLSEDLPPGAAILIDAAAWRRYVDATTVAELRDAYEQIRASTATITGLADG